MEKKSDVQEGLLLFIANRMHDQMLD